MAKPLSVFELTSIVRDALSIERLTNVWVSGELSNFKVHTSGHCYFTLKDERASMRMVMWRSKAASLTFRPLDGMKVLARGSISVYERDGNYQLYVDKLEPVGLGSLYLALEQLKQRLAAEGLFRTERKRPLPGFPRVVAVLTSPTGAAVRDIVTVMERRWPLARVLVFPVVVQGAEAAPSIASALSAVADYPEIDVVVLGRGGGSLEDLWAFNDELVVRAIFACPVPVVSAVGHETDFTLADLVADLRAPTPSAAALSVVPDRQEIERHLTQLASRMQRGIGGKISTSRQYLDYLSVRFQSVSPAHAVARKQQTAEALLLRMQNAVERRLQGAGASLAQQALRLQAISPLNVLARGYSVTRVGGNVLKSEGDVALGDTLTTTLYSGIVYSVVTGKEEAHELRADPKGIRGNRG
ncbi:MAG: Exodeoxyribonuclease 7 large subunit [Firmicutes bacterium]|nr:Exodeoxyribonuclease 7 large subunit [candidate division NPL-UPA2 bacterium]